MGSAGRIAGEGSGNPVWTSFRRPGGDPSEHIAGTGENQGHPPIPDHCFAKRARPLPVSDPRFRRIQSGGGHSGSATRGAPHLDQGGPSGPAWARPAPVAGYRKGTPQPPIRGCPSARDLTENLIGRPGSKGFRRSPLSRRLENPLLLTFGKHRSIAWKRPLPFHTLSRAVVRICCP